MDTMAGMQAADRGDIDAAVLMGGNLYAANPDSRWAERALDRIGFKLSLTTTLNRGHVMRLSRAAKSSCCRSPRGTRNGNRRRRSRCSTMCA